MPLTRPSFTLQTPNPNPANITNASWWLWLQLRLLEPTVGEFGGILAWKSGFHSTGAYNERNHPGNYSIRDDVNRTGSWWRDKSSALDWSFKDAKKGNYATIARYTTRLLKSARDSSDPRLDRVLYEFFGNADSDDDVEGWNVYKNQAATSDKTHLWHIHFSFLRSACGDYHAMWALLSVLQGYSVTQWRESIGEDGDDVATIDDVDKRLRALYEEFKHLRMGWGNVAAKNHPFGVDAPLPIVGSIEGADMKGAEIVRRLDVLLTTITSIAERVDVDPVEIQALRDAVAAVIPAGPTAEEIATETVRQLGSGSADAAADALIASLGAEQARALVNAVLGKLTESPVTGE